MPNKVNPQVLDAVKQNASHVLDSSADFALAALLQAESQSMSGIMQNNSASQQAMNQLNVAVISATVAQIVKQAPMGPPVPPTPPKLTMPEPSQPANLTPSRPVEE